MGLKINLVKTKLMIFGGWPGKYKNKHTKLNQTIE